MSDIFEEISKIANTTPKKHFVVIEGTKIQVDLQKKLEVLRHSEDKYMLRGKDIVLKPIVKVRRRFTHLQKSQQGYIFVDADPMWVDRVGEEGYEWQIKSE